MTPDSPFHLVQVNTSDAGGGAARVAWDLFAAYRRRGHDSRLVVGYGHSNDADVLVLPNPRPPESWSRFWLGVSRSLQRSRRGRRVAPLLGGLARVLANPSRSADFCLGLEHFRSPGSWRLLSPLERQPDVVHGHNLHGYYFDLRILPKLSGLVPLVLTLHDSWLLSGHCAHPLGCERWRSGCGGCPDLKIPPPIGRDATAYNWRRKRDLYARSRLYVATPSRKLMLQVEQSMLAAAVAEARVIPNGVELSTFQPRARSASRSALGIPRDARAILFSANGIRENLWKDYLTLRRAVAEVARQLHGEAILFLALGEAGPPEQIGEAEIRFIPYQSEAEVVASYYQAADVYVHAARADTFPCAVLEALACGTPVVATAVGGIPEQVEEARTGFLVPEGGAREMADRLVRLLSDDDLRGRMGKQAAESARQRFDLNRQVDAYLGWYAEMVEKGARQPHRKGVECAARQ